MFKLKVISRHLLQLTNKNTILTSHYMPNSSGLTAILIFFCFMNLLIYAMLNISDFHVKSTENSDFFNKKFEEDSKFLSVIFYFGYLSWRVLPPCWWVRHCDWPKSLPPWPIHSTVSLNHLDEKYPIQKKKFIKIVENKINGLTVFFEN